VVRDIFQLYSEGKTITEIVKTLNDRCLRTSRGHSFTHNSLRTVLKNKKYIGTYEYNGEVTIENSVPPIVDVDVFNKVQDLLAFNQKAGAHKKAKVDYILFGKLFCGKCGAMMTGVCGTSKQKVKHHYYICRAKKKKLCTKRAVRQDWGIVFVSRVPSFTKKEHHPKGWCSFLVVRESKTINATCGGMLLPPVQKLVATSIFAEGKNVNDSLRVTTVFAPRCHSDPVPLAREEESVFP